MAAVVAAGLDLAETAVASWLLVARALVVVVRRARTAVALVTRSRVRPGRVRAATAAPAPASWLAAGGSPWPAARPRRARRPPRRPPPVASATVAGAAAGIRLGSAAMA